MAVPTSPSLTDILCTQCGLCCDGSLLADVELGGRDDLVALELLGLEIEDPDDEHDGLLLLPCRALAGTRCSVYEHRPECCRTFECRLLQQVRRGHCELGQAQSIVAESLSRIRHVRSLATALHPDDERVSLKERCVEALSQSEPQGNDPRVRRLREALESAMHSLERDLRATFLKNSR